MIEYVAFEKDLTNLEDLVVKSWPVLEEHTSRLRPLKGSDLTNQTEIETMTMTATRMRMAYVNLLSIIETPAEGMVGRRFLEQAIQADAIDRLKILDDAIEVFEEFYRSERDLFADYRYYRNESKIVLLILLALVIQLMFPNQSFGPTIGQWITGVAYPTVTGFIGGLNLGGMV